MESGSKGKRSPPLGHLIQMSDLFHESLDALADRKILYAMSQEDRRILTFLERYKKLDQYGRRAVDAVCAVELDRIQEMNLRKEAPKKRRGVHPTLRLSLCRRYCRPSGRKRL